MKICYGSYNDRLPVEKRELFARAFADKMRKDLEQLSGESTEITCCPEKGDLVAAIKGGCDVVITEGKLRMPENGRDGDENVGYGTVREWKGLPGVKRVILLLPVDERPSLVKREDGTGAFGSGRKVVEMYRKGYYDALYVSDLKPATLVDLIRTGRSETGAKEYYGVTDDMLALLVESENGKRKKKEAASSEKKGMFGGLFARKEADRDPQKKSKSESADAILKEEIPEPEKPAADADLAKEKVIEKPLGEPPARKLEEPVSSNIEAVEGLEGVEGEEMAEAAGDLPKSSGDGAEAVQEECGLSAKEEDAAAQREKASDTEEGRGMAAGGEPAMEPAKEKHGINAETASVLKSLMSGGTDAFFDDDKEENKVAETESRKEKAGGFDFDFSFEPASAGIADGKAMEGPEANESAVQASVSTAAVAEPCEPLGIFAGSGPVLQGAAAGQRTGRVTSYLNGGTLLALELDAAPEDADVTRYGVTVIGKGSGRGRVVNGRYQSDVIAFEGFCVKLMMQRMVIVEVPDESAPPSSVVNRECMVTFTPLQ